jgi:hypothetical protein
MSHSLTENNAIVFSTSRSNLIDLYVNTVRGADNFESTMKKAWNELPILFIKLIYLTRDCRDGKGERDVSFKMLCFLRKYFFETYKLNIKEIISNYGRFKDLLDILNMNMNNKNGNNNDNNDDNNNYEIKLFATILKEDLQKSSPSLCVKWAPREGKKYKQFAYLIAKELFSDDTGTEHKNIMEMYRNIYIKPLSKKIKTIESYMCSNRWDEIIYKKVPAQAMRIYGREKSYIYDPHHKETQIGAFLRHDSDRFQNYLQQVKKGKVKINTSGIQPHQLVRAVMTNHDEAIQLQWDTIIDNLKNNNYDGLNKSIAVVDVSGSMKGEPMEVAIALGLILAELVSEPYKNRIITFSKNPIYHKIIGNTLHDKITNLSRIDWEMNTDIEKVFELLLNSANIHNIPKDKMIKNVFIFTDMQFDEAITKNKDTLFNNIKQKYKSCNYDLPKLIFWNLRTQYKSNNKSINAFPITVDDNGAYVSGFSINLLKIFMKGCDFNPFTILNSLLDVYSVKINENDKKFKFKLS